LSREVRVSASADQIEQLWDELKEANIKKGWELHSATTAAPASEIAETEEKTTKKKMATSARASKKKVVKKKSG
jgi:hypothetical protein